jgi:hypothetical protein
MFLLLVISCIKPFFKFLLLRRFEYTCFTLDSNDITQPHKTRDKWLYLCMRASLKNGQDNSGTDHCDIS